MKFINYIYNMDKEKNRKENRSVLGRPLYLIYSNSFDGNHAQL